MKEGLLFFFSTTQVSFWLNGKELHSTRSRGFTALVLAVDGEVIAAPASFDTNQGSEEFEALPPFVG